MRTLFTELCLRAVLDCFRWARQRIPGHLARVFRFLAHHRGSFLEFPCVLQDVVATSRPIRGQSAANPRSIRGQCAARAGLPEELRSSFLGVETFQEYSRTCWGCLEARQGSRRSAGTIRRAKETRREHERAKETSREARSQQRAWNWRAKEFPAIRLRVIGRSRVHRLPSWLRAKPEMWSGDHMLPAV